MLKIVVITLLTLAVLLGEAAAQTGPMTQDTQTTPNPTQEAFNTLSPSNQKIAQALYDAQQGSTSKPPLSLDEIAAMKQRTGWGEIFKELKAQGYFPQYKNLGQVVTHSKHPVTSGATASTTITTASGKSLTVGSAGTAEKSEKGRLSDDASSGGPGGGMSSGLGHDSSEGAEVGHGSPRGK